MRNLTRIVLLLILARPAAAHVGSPDIFFEGNAGPYRLFVTVRTPRVIPGVAGIEIRSQSAIREIRVAPLLLTGLGSENSPAPQVAERSADDPQFFACSVWLMQFGVFQLRIHAYGAQGEGQLVVPVPATVQGTLRMQNTLAFALTALMIFLSIGAVSVVGAFFRDGMLEPGADRRPVDLRRGRLAMLAAAISVVGILYLGNRWWNWDAEVTTSRIYRAPRLAANLESGGYLLLRATDPEWLQLVGRHPLIPDHGYLMHLFLVRFPEMDRFWHLHPRQIKPGVFLQGLPSMPSGRYRIFADVVHEDGFPETLLAEITVPGMQGSPLTGDDSEASARPVSLASQISGVSELPDGGRVLWERDAAPLKANVPGHFRFRIEGRDGKPVQDLEPYMGMAGHAEFLSWDGTVFAHVHPAGSVSMAALQIAEASLMPDMANLQPSPHRNHSLSAAALPPEVSFPYGFPRPGQYRIFVQMKRAGRIQTAVFDAQVK